MISEAARLARLRVPDDQTIAVTFVNDRQMARINWDFLGHEGTTDVITFAYLEDGELLPGETAVDLVICADFAVREGARRRHSDYASELALYVVHGLLHSAGEDDLAPETRRRMRRREREVMGELRKEFVFSAVFPAELPLTE